MIKFTSRGSFVKTETFLKQMSRGDIYRSLEQYAAEGVNALSTATPVDSGLASASWGYNITKTRNRYTITWTNTDVESGGSPVVILIQYGHGTGTGGYVQGRDFINPAIRPIFDRIAENVWKAVTSA